METVNKYPLVLDKFINDFIESSANDESIKKGNDKIMHSALFYERFRRAVEYQEDHLIFKNAVSRIFRRKYTLSFSVSVESLFDDLMNELAWADYINLDSISEDNVRKTKSAIKRYLTLLNAVKPHKMSRYEAEKIVIGWLACEIDEILFCRKRQEQLTNFALFCLKDNLKYINGESLRREGEIKLKLAILTLIYKPDYTYAQYWLIQEIFPDFRDFSEQKAVEIGLHFDNIIFQTEQIFNHKFNRHYLSYTKKHIAPFILIKEVPNYHRDLSPIQEDPKKLKLWLIEIYDKLLIKSRQKVWRGTIRALIFILITKVSLAFIIEMPFDQYIHGSIDYLPLSINIFLPPVLMLLSGALVKSPPLKNRHTVVQAINNLVVYQKLDSKLYYIGIKRRSSTESLFNGLYLVFNVAIVFGVIFLLRKIGFNVVNLTLFFIFISAVSFFSFRIRNIALELMMQISKENLIVSTIEFVFLPFILIGKFLSAALTKSNPFTITLDFLIEAPLKSIIKITNSWVRFIGQKKEDLDI